MDLQTSLFNLSGKNPDAIRLRDAVRGFLILGSTGSGKTSSSEELIADSFLKNKMGGIITTSKIQEAEYWIKKIERAGRIHDLVNFHEGGPYKLNFMDLVKKTENIVSMFATIIKMGDRSGAAKSHGSSDQFWENAMKRCLKSSILLLSLVDKKLLNLGNIVRIIEEAPLGKGLKREFTLLVESPDSEDKKEFDKKCEESFTYNCLAHAYHSPKTESEQRDFELVKGYFLSQFAQLADNTRTSITEQLYAFADPFMSGLLADYFTEETTPEILPEVTFEGKIVLLNFPVKEYLQLGIFAQVVYKYLWQVAVERRDTKKFPNPVFMICDECEYFLNEQDVRYQSTARESKACTVMVTQNLSNLYATIGGDNAKEYTHSIIGNLSTKIFHANDDSATNQFAADMIGHAFVDKATIGFKNSGGSMTEQRQYQVEPHKFTMLRTGSSENKNEVDAIVTCVGKRWSSNKNYLETVFSQKPL